MCFFFSFLPATGWLVIGFLVLFAASRTEGGLRSFGRVLGAWALVIALMFPVMGAYVTLSDACPMEAMMESMHSQQSP
jgi:hypothetical protein